MKPRTTSVQTVETSDFKRLQGHGLAGFIQNSRTNSARLPIQILVSKFPNSSQGRLLQAAFWESTTPMRSANTFYILLHPFISFICFYVFHARPLRLLRNFRLDTQIVKRCQRSQTAIFCRLTLPPAHTIALGSLDTRGLTSPNLPLEVAMLKHFRNQKCDTAKFCCG